MKKFQSLGKSLTKAEQKAVSGGKNAPTTCVPCSDGNVICGPSSSCTAVPEYGELWCSGSSGNITVGRCAS